MRILVTRPDPDAERTAAALAARGHAAVPAPVTAIRRQAAVLPSGPVQALAATSHHAFGDLGADFERFLPVYAVGRRTAEAARAAGFRDVRTGTGDASGLGDLLRLTLPRPARLIYLAGRDRKPALEEAMSAAGYEASVVETYAAEALAEWPPAVVEALRSSDTEIEAALHYSRRSAELALSLADRAGLTDAFLRLRHVCLSEDCAEPLRARGAPAVAVAARPDEDALLALLDAPPS